MIHYCRRCVLPETKPDLFMDDEGVCSACRHYERRKAVDWARRREDLAALLDRYRSPDRSNYDCIVPVSGGKDSTYQVVRMLEFGMNPLCVTASTDKISAVGRRNLDNIRRLGVDHIEVSVNPLVRRRINRLALNQVGDLTWPEHVTIFTVPVRMAVQLNVPLIIWGENSQDEYGGPAAASKDNVLTRRWLEEFGGLLGLRVSDLVGQDGIEPKDLIQYTYPADEALKSAGVTGLFLGHYLPWDGFQNTLIAQANGFESYGKVVEGSAVDYENLDNAFHGIHDYFKFLKFAFARAADISSLHVRRGRLTRADAITIANRADGRYPWSYLGVRLEEILTDLDMTREQFDAACDRFTNKTLFVRDSRGNLVRDSRGSLTKVNYDNPPAAESVPGTGSAAVR